PPDSPKLRERHGKVLWFDLRAWNIPPFMEGKFVDCLLRLRHGRSSSCPNQPSNNLDIKQPSSCKRFFKKRFYLRSRPKEFRAALCVIDAESQHQRRGCRE